MPRRPSVLVAAALAAACFAAALLSLRRPPPAADEFYAANSYVDLGEGLIHRVPVEGLQDVTHRMPLSTISTAWLRGHLCQPDREVRLALRVGILLLAAASGLLLWPRGVLWSLSVFSLLAVFVPLTPANGAYQELAFTLLTLLVAGLAVWRAQTDSRARTLALSLALGVSMLFRSVFILLGPLLLLVELLRPRERRRPRWEDWVLLGVLPYLWLLPWVGLNWALHRRFVFFEHEGADMNIAAAALGLVQGFTIETRALSAQHGSFLSWALGEVWAHPLRYASGFARRILYVIGLHPWLFAAASLSAWLNRRDRGAAALATVSAYFLLLYCTMGVVSRYFEPLWPLLALLAGALAAAPTRTSRLPAEDLSARCAAASLILFLGFSAACALYAQAAVWSYPLGDPAEPMRRVRAVEAALLRSPDEPWLLAQKGLSFLQERRPQEAAAALGKAAELSGGDPRYALEAAWAQALAGRPQALLTAPAAADESLSATNRGLNQTAGIYKALILLRLGRRAEGKERLRAAIGSRRSQNLLEGVETSEGDRVAAELEASVAGLRSWIVSVLRDRPASERLLVLEAVRELGLDVDLREEKTEVLLDRFDQRLGRHDRAGALKALEEAQALADTDLGLRRLEQGYESLGDDEGRCQLLSGPPGGDPRRPSSPELEDCLLRRFERSRAGKDPQAALRALGQAQRSADSEEALHRIALGYQSLGEDRRQSALLRRLISRQPGRAVYWSDLGVGLYRMGRTNAAIGALRTALRLDPGFLPAGLTLGGVLAAQGRREEAGKVYEGVLANSRERSDMRRMLEEGLAELRGRSGRTAKRGRR